MGRVTNSNRQGSPMNMESNRIAEVCRAKRISKKRAIQRTAAVGFGAIASISGAFALNDNAHAARPEGSNPANQGTSITIAETRSTIANSSVSTLVTFAVSANVRPKDEQYVWVRNSCTIAGQMVSVEYQPVENSFTRPFSLVYAPTGTECTASVFVWPNTASTLDGGSMVYRAP